MGPGQAGPKLRLGQTERYRLGTDGGIGTDRTAANGTVPDGTGTNDKRHLQWDRKRRDLHGIEADATVHGPRTDGIVSDAPRQWD